MGSDYLSWGMTQSYRIREPSRLTMLERMLARLTPEQQAWVLRLMREQGESDA